MAPASPRKRPGRTNFETGIAIPLSCTICRRASGITSTSNSTGPTSMRRASGMRRAATGTDERRLALQFLLHLVGDLHQPLHAADNRDHGGNDIRVKGAGSGPGTLHHYWDTVFVRRLGTRADDVSRELIAGISDDDRRAWSGGSPADWAKESFQIARNHVYGPLQHTGSPSGAGVDVDPGISGGGHPRPITLDARYESDAGNIVAGQLQRAGLRLARLLNDALR